MKKVIVLCVAIGVSLTTTAVFARGGGMGGMGGGMHGGIGSMAGHLSVTGGPVTGGAFGTSAATPGTNSLGTALATNGAGRPQKGSLLGTSPAIDHEDAKVDKMIGSICRGC